MISDNSIQSAKKRIWSQIERQLPDRGVSRYQSVLNTLSAEAPQFSPLKKVQLKEHLFDLLPDKKPSFSLFTRRVWASATLLFVFGFLFMPVLKPMPMVSASTLSFLKVGEGEVSVNGSIVSDSVTIQTGDHIETASNGLAHLYLADDSRVTLGPDSEFEIVDIMIDPSNRAHSEVELRAVKGEAWVQVLNLVSGRSFLALDFPDGEVRVSSRASFDIKVEEDVRIGVSRNIVDLSIANGEIVYDGVLSQGLLLTYSDEISTSAYVPDENDWGVYNLAFGKDYERRLDERYKKENLELGIILPGHPLYALKTFRENLQVSLAFSTEAKQQLLVGQAESRLEEAQTLLNQGNSDSAQTVLNAYEATVDKVMENSDNPKMLAVLEEKQKELSVSQDPQDLTILEAQLSKTSVLLPSDVEGKAEVKILSASQKLQRVPDLVENGNYEQAIEYLTSYQKESLSILAELGSVPMGTREQMVSSSLEQKLRDIQILRILAAMPELSSVDIGGQMLKQMSMLVLSLRERELSNLSDFFSSVSYDLDVEKDLYERLRNHIEIAPQLSEQFDSVEQELSTVKSTPVAIQDDETPLVTGVEGQGGAVTMESKKDPRFE